MIVVLTVVIALLAAALGGLALRHRTMLAGGPAAPPGAPARRILFPFAAAGLSRRALDAALRLARAEDAVLVPVFLARVPLHLPLDAPLPRQAGMAIPLQEAIEHRAVTFGVPVDARIERGRSYRHGLRQTIDHEPFDRIVIAAARRDDGHGFGPDDVAWLLANAPGEIVVLRAAAEDRLEPAARRARRRTRGAERATERAHSGATV